MTTRTLQTPLGRRPLAAAFAIALFTGLSASSLFAQGYYPPANSPIDNNPNLQNIEGRLAATATLVVPAPAGKHVATDDEIAAALGLAVADELDGTPNGGGVSLSGLVNEISKYRPSKTGDWATAAVAKVLAETTVANIPTDLETVTAAAVSPNPKGAAKVVKNSIKLIAVPSSSSAVDLTADDIVEQAVANAADYTHKIVGSAMASAKKINAADLIKVEQDIVSEAVQEAVAAGANYIIDEAVTAAEKGRAPGVSAGVIAAAAFSFRSNHETTPGAATGFAVNKLNVGLVTGGALRGAGVGQVASVTAGVDGATGAAFTAYITQVGNGFTTASGNSDPVASAGLVLASIDNTNKDYIPAILQGAVAWLNRNDTGLLGGANGALKKNIALGGASTTVDIVEAVVAGVQKDAKKIAVSALTAVGGGVTLHDIAEGTGRGADVGLVGAAAGAMVKNSTINASNVNEVVDGAIDGAVGTSKNGAIGDVAFQATKASKLGVVVVGTAVNSSPVGDAYRAVAGAVAGDKKAASAIKTAGLAARGDDDDTANTFAADTVIAIQLAPKASFNAVTSKLTDAGNTQQIYTEAIVTGAGLANPKGAMANVAAAISLTSFSTSAIIDAAKQTNRKKAFNIGLAANAAIHVKADTSDLFDYINHTTFQNPKFSADIVTGATVAAPGYTHIIGHAAAFAAPATASKMVPALFAYSQLDNHLAPNISNPVAAAAAISAGLTCGILEAKSPKELAYLKSAVSAAVKAALLLEGPGATFRQSTGSGGAFTLQTEKGAAGVVTGYISQSVDVGQTDIAGGAAGTIGAILTAATKAAKKYALEIVQAAGQAAAAISGNPGGYVGSAIAAAVFNGGSKFSLAQIQAALNFGIAEAVANRVGAGAAGVLDYTHFHCTGAPVTSIFNL